MTARALCVILIVHGSELRLVYASLFTLLMLLIFRIYTRRLAGRGLGPNGTLTSPKLTDVDTNKNLNTFYFSGITKSCIEYDFI